MLIGACAELNQKCYDLQQFLSIVKLIIKIIQWTVPIILIILGSIDMFKAMSAAEDKDATVARKAFIRRLIFGITIFIVPFLVRLLFNIISLNIKDGSDATSWINCWMAVDNKNTAFFNGCDDIYKEEVEERKSESEEEIDDTGDTENTKKCFFYKKYDKTCNDYYNVDDASWNNSDFSKELYITNYKTLINGTMSKSDSDDSLCIYTFNNNENDKEITLSNMQSFCNKLINKSDVYATVNNTCSGLGCNPNKIYCSFHLIQSDTIITENIPWGNINLVGKKYDVYTCNVNSSVTECNDLYNMGYCNYKGSVTRNVSQSQDTSQETTETEKEDNNVKTSVSEPDMQKCIYYRYQKYDYYCDSKSDYNYLYNGDCYFTTTATKENCEKNNNIYVDGKCLVGHKEALKRVLKMISTKSPTETYDGKADKYECTMSKNLNCKSIDNLKKNCTEEKLISTITGLKVKNEDNFGYDDTTKTFTCYKYYSCYTSERDEYRYLAIVDNKRRCYKEMSINYVAGWTAGFIPGENKVYYFSGLAPSGSGLDYARTIISETKGKLDNFTDNNNNEQVQCSKKCNEAKERDCK